MALGLQSAKARNEIRPLESGRSHHNRNARSLPGKRRVVIGVVQSIVSYFGV